MNSDSGTTWFRNSAIWQVIFVLIILYNVSSINVLVLTISVLPVLQGAFLQSHVLVYFGEISFIIAAFLGIYHLSSMFRSKKRKTDETDDEKVSFGQAISRARFFSKLVFALIILYVAASVYLRIWSFGGLELAVGSDVMWIIYSLISFGLATICAAFHLSTMILRRKRKSDRLR
jgi:putative Mn2+ efflux pump MntP